MKFVIVFILIFMLNNPFVNATDDADNNKEKGNIGSVVLPPSERPITGGIRTLGGVERPDFDQGTKNDGFKRPMFETNSPNVLTGVETLGGVVTPGGVLTKGGVVVPGGVTKFDGVSRPEFNTDNNNDNNGGITTKGGVFTQGAPVRVGFGIESPSPGGGVLNMGGLARPNSVIATGSIDSPYVNEVGIGALTGIRTLGAPERPGFGTGFVTTGSGLSGPNLRSGTNYAYGTLGGVSIADHIRSWGRNKK